ARTVDEVAKAALVPSLLPSTDQGWPSRGSHRPARTGTSEVGLARSPGPDDRIVAATRWPSAASAGRAIWYVHRVLRTDSPVRHFLSHDGVALACEVAVPIRVGQLQFHVPGQQGSARSEGHRRDGDDHLIEQATVGELAGQVPTADYPDVLALGGFHQPRVQLRDVSTGESQIRAHALREVPIGEHPAGN